MNIFRCKMILCAIYQKWIFCVFVGLFWSTSWNRNSTPNNVFKRKTYSLENSSFRSLFIFQKILIQKASKPRFFLFIIFEFFVIFQILLPKFFEFSISLQFQRAKNEIMIFPFGIVKELKIQKILNPNNFFSGDRRDF